MGQFSSTTLENRLLARARFRHMQVLVAVAELGSIRRAADAVAMTQPGVTKVLADLEGLLETVLFHRHSRGVRPTPACIELLSLARQIVGGVASTAAAIGARHRQGEGTVRVAGTSAAINGAIAAALLAFNEKHPKIQVQVSEADADDLLLATARGEVDVAVCREPRLVPEGWSYRDLVQDRLVIACGVHHPLVRKRRVRLKDVQHELWLPGHAAALSRRHMDAFAEELGKPLRYCELVTRIPALTWTALRTSNAIALVPYSVVRPFVEARTLSILSFERNPPLAPIGLLLPEISPRPAALLFSEYLERFHAIT